MFDDILFYLHSQIGAMDLSFNWTNLLEIFVIVLILYAFYKKFIKNTQSEKFVKGIFILIFVWVFGEILVRLDLKNSRDVFKIYRDTCFFKLNRNFSA